MTRRTDPRPLLRASAELLAWWLALALLWLVFVTSVDTLERIVGAGCAAVGAVLARAGRRAVRWR
ncbi:hypothetical protein NX794_30395 [Streptomyces sp. LP11]|uniref:Uncharacterized protein n=1 Tax=Streptomyces pyxinicus TaxID=2970331 RepID=A0ABT2BAF2_9ACTN|nr:hypothetical protein [Streptomyces sp. LP11]MCS0605482.1 hypothetical protein [Streptomyces sp. LP11]